MLTVDRVRKMLKYEIGVFPSVSHVDKLVIEHLDTVRELAKLDIFHQELVIAVCEGWTIAEISAAFGISRTTIERRLLALRISLYGDGSDEVITREIAMEGII